MTRENAEAARLAMDRFQAMSDMVAYVAETWDEAGDYYPVWKFPGARPCHGRDEIASFLTEFRQAWAAYESTVEQTIPVGDDRVLIHSRIHAAGRESGLTLDGDVFHAIWLRHGRYLRQEDHLTVRGGLRALGLDGDSLEAAGLAPRSNVDTVRRLYAAWERGDFSDVDCFDPALEFGIDFGPDRITARGVDGLRRVWREQLRLWESWSTGPIEEVFEQGEHVVVRHSLRGQSRHGLSVDSDDAGAAFRFRDGRIVFLLAADHIEKALDAVGLSSGRRSA